MRVGIKRFVLYIVTACLVLFIVIRFHKGGQNSKILDSDCQVSQEIRDNLLILLSETSRILNQFKVNHFLCYGSLWGIIKSNGLLPWEDNVEVCAMNEELSSFEEATLIRTFLKHNLALKYDSKDGVYEVFEPGQKVKGILRIVVFEKDPDLDMMKRVGWARRLLPPDCEMSPSLHCFPPRLIETPLPIATINGVEYKVPREEIEIQKYLYPDTWWKEIKPKQC